MFGRGFEPRNSNVKYCLPTLVICNRTAERKWTLRGLNPGPADYESDALTAELSPLKMGAGEGFEPPTSGL